jgi:hypothetical protein
MFPQTRELARIKAVQTKWTLDHYGTLYTTPNPLPFELWFLERVRDCEARGADILLDPVRKQVQITWPNSQIDVLNIEDFKTVYYTEYKPRFGKNAELPDFELEVFA